MEVYMNGPVVITHTIKAGTVVKVVVVAAIASYFARNVVKVIDDVFAGVNTGIKVSTQKSDKTE